MRFTVQRMMFAVAVLGTFLAGIIPGVPSFPLFRRAREYRHQAFGHALIERNWVEEAEALSPGGPKWTTLLQRGYPADYMQRKVARARRFVLHEAQLKRKYERAASRPWLPVAPDPPDPK
jgi:hypothetical protein